MVLFSFLVQIFNKIIYQNSFLYSISIYNHHYMYLPISFFSFTENVVTHIFKYLLAFLGSLIFYIQASPLEGETHPGRMPAHLELVFLGFRTRRSCHLTETLYKPPLPARLFSSF